MGWNLQSTVLMWPVSWGGVKMTFLYRLLSIQWNGYSLVNVLMYINEDFIAADVISDD